jgi:flagellar biosynthesis GTPase FlhF
MSTPGDLLEALGREARNRLGGARERAEGVRLYRGRSIEELIPQIERELGADALIVARREGLTGGVLGFFQHAYVEIEAMPGTPGLDVYDEREAAVPPPFVPPPPPVPSRPAPVAPSAPVLPAAPFGYPPPAARAAPPPPAPVAPAPPAFVPEPLAFEPTPSAPAPMPMPAPSQSLARGVPEMGFGSSGPYVSPQLAALARAEPPPPPMPPPRAPAREAFDFEELLTPTPPLHREPPQQPRRAVAPPPERRTVAPGSQSRVRARVEKSLLRYGISESFARELIDAAEAHTLPLAPRSGLAQAVLATLARRIPTAPPLPLAGAAIVLVGPGGAGKTSCCATLLGAYRSASTLPASFASLITSPDGEQLQMLLAPQIVKPALASSARATSALRKARREGMAILDTPPLSPADRVRVRDLARLLGELAPERVVVALPATLGATAAQQLLDALAPLHANSLAITHADETDQIGVAVEAACMHDLAPEYTLERGRAGGWLLRRVDPADLAARMLP